jgi:hypothetical protein
MFDSTAQVLAMASRPRMILASIAIVCVAMLVAVWIAARRQQSALSTQIDDLRRAATVQAAAQSVTPQLDDLPAPVARYLRLALPTTTHIQEIRIRQTGRLRTDVSSERWLSFEAEHIVTPAATGFVWNARVKVAPLLHVRVRDLLIDGKASGQVSLLSAFTVSADTDTPEMNSGSLHRYLAEAAWYPTALLPSATLRWTAIDAARSLATLTNHGVTVALEFRFAATGEVTGIYTPGRWGTFSGGYRQLPWEGHFRNYRNLDGIFVPTDGDVGWYVDTEWHAVWKGSITALELRTVSR